ncbi:Glycosyl transferase family 2 [Marinobacter daqiaonensis]|uniref:Glycosyl transferase family 2 n=1 Tax=Marinobacter daqiaonensis TaxID=650891 RepID=A0A1I6H9F2_9GAMM|nr:glycosyltransferase [Marinobacter daqiaonensis]SFR51008.1 Glycosyl transferase family 2 [Marinobacter daqiaonensis]
MKEKFDRFYGHKVTIITLSYNDFSRIERTIRSVFDQDIFMSRDVEYIIADDGSDNYNYDFLVSKVSEYCCNEKIHCSFLIYSNEKNLGTVKSFNKAVSLSSGDIIIPLSSGDEFYNKSSVSTILRAFESSNFQMLTAFREILSNDQAISVRPVRRDAELLKKGDRKETLKALAVKGNFISGACTYYQKKFLQEMGGFDEDFVLLEDYPLYLKALKKGYSIGFIDRITMKHQIGGVSMSGRRKDVHPELINDFAKVREWITKNIPMTKRDRRYFNFFQVKSRKQRLSPKTILFGFDCFAVWLCLYIYDGVKDKINK